MYLLPAPRRFWTRGYWQASCLDTQSAHVGFWPSQRRFLDRHCRQALAAGKQAVSERPLGEGACGSYCTGALHVFHFVTALQLICGGFDLLFVRRHIGIVSEVQVSVVLNQKL